MKLKVIIVDDELHARSFLRKLCERYYIDRIEVVDECISVESAVVSIRKYKPDLVFLDIQMPNENGFHLLDYFDGIPFEIIFTTAYKDHALEAIKCSALDFLVKPIGVDDFKNAIHKYNSKTNTNIGIDRFKLLSENINNQFADKQRIIFSTKNGFKAIQANTIVYCKAEESYTNIYTIEDDLLSSKSFKEICELLVEPTFIKVHKSYLVNVNYIKSFNSVDYTLEMITDAKVLVSDKSFTKKKLIDAITK